MREIQKIQPVNFTEGITLFLELEHLVDRSVDVLQRPSGWLSVRNKGGAAGQRVNLC